MKIPFRFLGGALVLALVFSLVSPLRAQDPAPIYVAKPIADVNVSVGSVSTIIKIKKTFGLTGISGKVVRFSTNVGNLDVGLLQQEAPQTVARFLAYANTPGTNRAGVYTYNDTLIQRAVPSFVVQGGGFYVDAGNQINQIVGRPTIPSEAGVKNTRGTLAMALSTGPDSGTGDFFFNVADNANLDDSSNGGPFTVFGKVVGSLATLDAIEALPQQNFSAGLGGAFQNVPLVNYSGGDANVGNLVRTNSITTIPLVPATPGAESVLGVTVKSNSNPGLVSAAISGNKLTLSYVPGQTGTAVIVLKAKNKATKSKLTTRFNVTVQ